MQAGKKVKLSAQLSKCINYVQSIHFKGFENLDDGTYVSCSYQAPVYTACCRFSLPSSLPIFVFPLLYSTYRTTGSLCGGGGGYLELPDFNRHNLSPPNFPHDRFCSPCDYFLKETLPGSSIMLPLSSSPFCLPVFLFLLPTSPLPPSLPPSSSLLCPFSRAGKIHQMSSFGEGSAMKYSVQSASRFMLYNKRQLSRIYPAGSRVNSSNYDPVNVWNCGCQIGLYGVNIMYARLVYTGLMCARLVCMGLKDICAR